MIIISSAPVSFSIKKAREEQPKEIKSALPVEESDEEDSGSNTPNNATTPPPTINRVASTEHSTSPKENIEVDVPDKPIREVVKDNKKNGILDGDDPILEMIELTSDIGDKKDAKRAEDRIKDKLAAAAREKLALVSRDRALQLERKKKAAAFLKLKSAEHNTQSTDQGPEKTNSSTPPSRRNSVEIIEVVKEKEVISKKSKTKERSRSREKRKSEREKSEAKEKKDEKARTKIKERERSREKEKRSRTPRKEEEEGIENKKRRDDDRKEKKKKSHKRKHSKSRHESRSKKKSKKRHRRSESNSSGTSSTS